MTVLDKLINRGIKCAVVLLFAAMLIGLLGLLCSCATQYGCKATKEQIGYTNGRYNRFKH